MNDAPFTDHSAAMSAALASGDTLYDVLASWRDAEPPLAKGLTDRQLRMLSRGGQRTPEQIASMYPTLSGDYALQAAELIRKLVPGVAAPEQAGDERSSPAPPSAGSQQGSTSEDVLPSTGAVHVVPTLAPVPPVGDGIDMSGVVAFDYSAQEAPFDASVSTTREGDTRLTWPAHDEACFYRVVSRDGEYAPISPDEAMHHIATEGVIATDILERQHGIRHYQVWRHVGPTIEAAKLNQPVLHAKKASPTPVREVSVVEDSGTIIGKWKTLAGIQQVHVYRVPASEPTPGVSDPRFRILESDPNLYGFIDKSAQRGVSYRYHFVTEVVVNGVSKLSAPYTVEVTPSITLTAVSDLDIRLHDSAARAYFDLAWTNPAGGEVVIYRTDTPPAAGIDRSSISVDSLDHAGLGMQHRLVHPVTSDGITSYIRGVSWPEDWTRAYFTPVVLHDGRAQVGRTVTGVRVGPAKNPTLTDRFHRQVLSFGWPKGATRVHVYQTAPGGDVHTANQAGLLETVDSLERYRESGGVSFPRGKIGTVAGACDIHVVGVAFEDGQAYESAPVAVGYTPVVPLRYSLNRSYSLFKKFNGLTVDLHAPEMDISTTVHVTLISNRERLPLTPDDGDQIPLRYDFDDGASWQNALAVGPIQRSSPLPTTLRADLRAFQQITMGTGYVRLFILHQPDQMSIALLDPPVRSLMLQAGTA